MDRNDDGILKIYRTVNVVPYVGTWIEIYMKISSYMQLHVVPYVGTWIEISAMRSEAKYDPVVPYVGTWIEICRFCENLKCRGSRSLRGNVDRNRSST